ncbi:transformation system protein [Helicobacter aurati]|uniref:Transformation system protein n=1 Tax=Helicobacter aurati TaxID=137778 RepID=A0A3D8J1C4_9HELI|nr:transformation system protein [Helicobacter aurati]RDU71329.1 transformation system protein [Helicobacter aurati]
MYCIICHRLKFNIICQKCLNSLWHIESKRQLDNGLKVFSSFAFSELKTLLHTKDNSIGSRVFKRLGTYGVTRFFDTHKNLLELDRSDVAIVCVRNKHIGLYSHSAILAHCFKQFRFKVFYNVLITGNNIRFMQLSLQERKRASREFYFVDSALKGRTSIILVDDVITTGQTLFEASHIINSSKIHVLCAWTLCDARF